MLSSSVNQLSSPDVYVFTYFNLTCLILFSKQQIGGSWKQQEDRITFREMKVLILIAIVTSAQFFGILNGHKGHKHHNHKPSKSKSSSKADIREGRVSTRSKPFRKAFEESFDSYKSSKKEDKRTKENRKRQNVSEGKRREEIGSEPNTQGGNLSRPSPEQPYHYVIEVEQNGTHDTRKKAGQKNLGIANINRFQNSGWLNKQVSRNEGERKQLDIPGCGGLLKL